LKVLEANLRTAESDCNKARLALEDPAIAANAAELIARQKTLEAAQHRMDELFKRWETLEAARIQ